MEKIKNDLIACIHKKYNIDATHQIIISDTCILCKSTDLFDFSSIFIVYDWRNKFHDCNKDPICNGYPCKQYTNVGTDEDNNIIIPNEYASALNEHHVVFNENQNIYFIQK